MKITWYGQASFGIESSDGLKIVTIHTTNCRLNLSEPADIVIKSVVMIASMIMIIFQAGAKALRTSRGFRDWFSDIP